VRLNRLKHMTSTSGGTSVCGRCRFYHLTGRRGGECHQFGVPVKASWKACSLAQSPFEVGLPPKLPMTQVWGEPVRGIAPQPVTAALPTVKPCINQPRIKPTHIEPAHIEPATPVAVPSAE